MTATWTCPECRAVNSTFIMDCGTCGASKLTGTGSVLGAEGRWLQNTESLGELRIALQEQDQQLEAMRDSLNELWPLVDSLKARLAEVEQADDLYKRIYANLWDEAEIVTTQPVFVDNAELELAYD